MPNNYESLKTDGHFTMAKRIFSKMKTWVESKVQTDVPTNAEFTDTLPTAYCDTNAGTTAKVAKCTNFSLKNNSFISINFKNGNTVTRGTGITLNINNTGAKPVYVDFINDNSIPTDTPFDAGTYILYYTNQAYYLYTNGVLYPYRDVAKQNDLKYYSFGSQDGSVIITEGASTEGGATTYTENMSVQKVNGHTVNSDVPSNAVFTDTKVTSVGNHYAPTEDSSATLSADASSTTAATWNSTSLVTGVDIKRDAKGHVTGVAVDSIKMPSNPDTNTHRPIQVNGTQILGNNTTALNLVPGDNVSMTNSSGSVTVSADQIDDTYDYDDYLDLPDSIKMQDKIFMVSGAPKPVYFRYIEETETIIFTNGYAHYNAETESISLGG